MTMPCGANVTLIEDIDRATGERILWFCINVFITAEFARFLRTEAPPLVAHQVLEWRRDACSPLLTLPELRSANAPGGGGVIMLTLNSGSRPEIMAYEGSFAGSEWQRVGQKVAEYSCWAIGGYNLNEAWIEAYSDVETAWATQYGYCLVREWRGWTPPCDPPSDMIPRLLRISRAEGMEQVATVGAELFRYSAPQFFFSPAEQEMLRSALFGETDEELAELLGVALVTVKKRWLSVYNRVSEAMSELFSVAVCGKARRGAEKKRRLLGYLRHHLEELRPVASPKDAVLPLF